MENAVKAMLIAAGVFMAIMIVSLLLVFYNSMSSYYTEKHETTLIEQATKFNAKFENYNRQNIRGSDLISLMNRIIDYNATESYFEEKSYERIRVTITLGEDSILDEFKPENAESTGRNEFLLKTITNTNGNNWEDDKKLIAITNTPSEMCQKAKNPSVNLNMITDTKLQQLASKASNIFVDENSMEKRAIYNRLYRAEMLKNLLGEQIIIVDEEKGAIGIGDAQSTNRLAAIKEITSQYYQYMQFKRAKFDCTEVKYDTETGRIEEMNFKLQTKLVNGAESVVFD